MVCWQQAITWANVDQNWLHHMASLGHNELSYHAKEGMVEIVEKFFSNRGIIPASYWLWEIICI